MASTRVYIGGITHRCRESDLEYFFRKYGKIRDISIKNKFAFIEFDDARDADDACYDLHKKEFMGEIVTVELARGTPHGRDKERWGYGSGRSRSRSRSRSRRRRSRSRSRSRRYSRSRSRSRSHGGSKRRPVWLDKYGPPTRTEYRIIVENLSSRVSWQDLKDVMRSAGDVTYADAHRQKRNEGVVEFASYNDVKNVIEKLDGKELNGRAIKIIDDSRGGGSKRRSRSRSNSRRSRSRSRGSRRSRSRSRSRRSRSRSGDRRDKSRSRGGSRDRKSRSRSRSGS
eukprot:TRINITY_DN802_c0_g1_i1.p1 TRINITY_DN802_c0_g1~~TRINITY_DN802_c0_g1_i1.p1  ORF type:complete len:284 (+),score=59.42 TRINITY_DN802_c0_g1_i1:49-900(+)